MSQQSLNRARREPDTGSESSENSWLPLVRDQVGSLKFGTVVITVHEGRVVQVEKNERLRFNPSGDQQNQPTRTPGGH